jgi:hypothetical protein
MLFFSLWAVKIVVLAHAIARVVKSVEILAGRRATYWVGVAAFFIALRPASSGQAPFVLSHGSPDHGVMAATTVGSWWPRPWGRGQREERPREELLRKY